MADDVQVKFGASIEGLIASIEGAKEAIESLRVQSGSLGGILELLAKAWTENEDGPNKKAAPAGEAGAAGPSAIAFGRVRGLGDKPVRVNLTPFIWMLIGTLA